MLGEELRVPPPLADHRRPPRRRSDRARRRREPLHRRGRVRAGRGRLRRRPGGRRLLDRGRRHRQRRARRLGPAVERDDVACRSRRCRPISTRRFADAAHVVECTVRQNRTSACRWRAAASSPTVDAGRDELDLVCSCQSVHETRNFFARYLDIPESSVRVSARDVGGGFGQKMFVFREECAVVLASRLLGRPVKWIEDRRENLIVGAALAQRAGRRASRHRRRPDHPGDHDRPRRRRRRLPGVPGGDQPAAAARAVPDPAPRVLDEHGVDQHDGQGRVPRPVDVRDDGPRDGHRPRRPHARHRPDRAAPTQPAAPRRPAVHVARRAGVLRDHPAGDARAGARDARLRRVPRRAGRGPRRGAPARPRLLRLRRADRRWRARRWPPRARRSASRRAARSSPSSAPRRTARASRRRWPRSSPTPRRRLRRRHDRAGRHPVDAVRAGHRRQPHRGHRRRRGTRGAARSSATRCSPIAAHLMEAEPRRPRDRRRRSCSVRGTPDRVDDASARSPTPPTAPPTSCRPTSAAGLEATVRFRPDPLPDVVERHPPLRRRDRPRHLRPARRCATSSARTAAG